MTLESFMILLDFDYFWNVDNKVNKIVKTSQHLLKKTLM